MHPPHSAKEEARKQAVVRHDIDSSIFQGRYLTIDKGRFTNEFIYGRYQIFEEVSKDVSKLQPGAAVLDLGCGTGHFADYLHKKGFKVTGIDPSEGMLEYATKNFPEVSFIKGSATSLPFPDNHFDYVLCIEVLRYLHPEDVAASYREISRVLKPGGFFQVTQVNTLASEGYYIFYHLDKFINNTLRGRDYHSGYFTDSAREERLVKEAGFENVEVIGRMFASIRIGYKFGNFIGRTWAKFLELFDKKQYFKSGLKREIAGHLIVRGTKKQN
jgi:ubiquinone/menaquinone biosynthesis C-methylase UbiE